MRNKINIVGAGPVGLYAAALLRKTLDSSNEINIYERLSREESAQGMGYTFIPETFELLGLLKNGSDQSLDSNNPMWDAMYLITKTGRMTSRKSVYNFSGVPRVKLMTELQNTAQELGINVNYDHEITRNNFEKIKDADLAIVSTGVRNLFSEEELKAYKPQKIEAPISYSWTIIAKSLPGHILTTTKFNGTPTVVNSYPITLNASVSIAEVLTKDIEPFCNANLGLRPNDFSPLKIKMHHNPCLDNVLLIGDAAHNPYFCTGAGLVGGFASTKMLVKSLNLGGRLTDRAKEYAQLIGMAYNLNWTTNKRMIDTKITALTDFDRFTESELLQVVSGVGLE